MDIITILKRTKKELINKTITSVIIQGLLLLIPVFWTKSINYASDYLFSKSFKLVIITLMLSLFYYLWSYYNQKTWYNYYNKLYLEYTNIVTSANVSNITLGEYTNIINNDIDIICNFTGNSVVRIIQIIDGAKTKSPIAPRAEDIMLILELKTKLCGK